MLGFPICTTVGGPDRGDLLSVCLVQTPCSQRGNIAFIKRDYYCFFKYWLEMVKYNDIVTSSMVKRFAKLVYDICLELLWPQ